MIFGSLQDVYQSCSDLCCRHLHQRMPLLGRSIRLRQGLKIIKSNVIDAITLLLGKDAIYADRWDWDVLEVDNSQIHVGRLGVDRQYVMKI